MAGKLHYAGLYIFYCMIQFVFCPGPGAVYFFRSLGLVAYFLKVIPGLKNALLPAWMN
jgi:hypothetical protein